LFYDDKVDQKVKASKYFLYLCYSHENMMYMIEHETLFGVVSRTLRESFKDNLDMTLYLLNVFQSYSNFTQFHQFLMSNQIGDTTVKIVEHEIKRYKNRVKDFRGKMEIYEKARAAGSEEAEAMEQHLRKEERNLSIMIKKQEKVLFVAFHLLMNLAEDL